MVLVYNIIKPIGCTSFPNINKDMDGDLELCKSSSFHAGNVKSHLPILEDLSDTLERISRSDEEAGNEERSDIAACYQPPK